MMGRKATGWYRHGAAMAILVYAGCGSQTAERVDTNAAKTPARPQTFSLRIDFGDGRETSMDTIEWKPDTTALDALRAAEAEGVAFRQRGQGATAFVESVGGLDNTGSGKNWLFYVNGEKADQGAGVRLVQPNDVVLWKYTDEK